MEKNAKGRQMLPKHVDSTRKSPARHEFIIATMLLIWIISYNYTFIILSSLVSFFRLFFSVCACTPEVSGNDTKCLQ